MEVQDYSIANCSSNSTVEEVEFVYRWNIHKAILQNLKLNWGGDKEKECFKSSVFTAGKNTQYSWHLQLKEYVKNGDEGEYLLSLEPDSEFPYTPAVGLDLCLNKFEEENGDTVMVSVQFSILDGDNNPVHQIGEKDDVQSMESGDDIGEVLTEAWETVLDPTKGYIFNNHLNIHCRVWIHERLDINQSHKSQGLSVLNSSLRALRDFKNLLKFPVHSDFVITTPTNEFKAHKNILSVRSSVFAAMFQSDLVEAQSGTMTISDFSDNIIKEMLNFIYSGEVENMAGNEIDLLQIADKYNIEDLKLQCSAAIFKSLTCKNAIQILIDVDRNNNGDLKKDVIDFIARNKQSVKSTDEFLNLYSFDPKLFLELISAIL